MDRPLRKLGDDFRRCPASGNEQRVATSRGASHRGRPMAAMVGMGVLGLALAGLLGGCGAAAAPAKASHGEYGQQPGYAQSPASPTMSQPGMSPHGSVSIESLGLHETDSFFDQTEQQLKWALDNDEPYPFARPPTTAGVPPTATNPPPPPDSSARPYTNGDARSVYPRNTRCYVACRALESMQRAAQHICELAGDQDDRCEDVRQRVERARSLVYLVCSECEAAAP
jgi:hypothetical protein